MEARTEGGHLRWVIMQHIALQNHVIVILSPSAGRGLMRCCMLSGKGDVTITMDDDDMLKLMMGQMNPQQVNNSQTRQA